MTQPSSAVQKALARALLETLRSPDLTPEDAVWVREFAMRTITEFNLLKSQPREEAPQEPVAA